MGFASAVHARPREVTLLAQGRPSGRGRAWSQTQAVGAPALPQTVWGAPWPRPLTAQSPSSLFATSCVSSNRVWVGDATLTLFIHLYFPLSIHSPSTPPPHPFICPSFSPSVCPSLHPPIYPPTHSPPPSIYPPTHPSFSLTILLASCLSVHPSIAFIHPASPGWWSCAGCRGLRRVRHGPACPKPTAGWGPFPPEPRPER